MWKPKYQKLEELVPYIEGGKLCTEFDYEVDKKRHFKSICTDVLPDINTMRLIYDCQMRVQVELELTIKGNKITYSINHLRLSDYEWVESK